MKKGNIHQVILRHIYNVKLFDIHMSLGYVKLVCHQSIILTTNI